MNKPKFQFGQIVVVDESLIGVICKTWGPGSIDKIYKYEVYVRYHNSIAEYKESEINYYIYSKELFEDELDFY